MAIQIIQGDCLSVLQSLQKCSVNCCVTSPPYWGLRDYGCSGQIGLEATVEEYVDKMVKVFREVRRVLVDDGTLWLNLGDSYNTAGRKGHGSRVGDKQQTNRASASGQDHVRPSAKSLKPKDLIGIPWRVAFALQADGWYLRQDIIWHKPNPMPESVRDRCTKSHEYVFLLSKSERYYFNHRAIMVKASAGTDARYERGRSDNHKYVDGGPGKQTIARTFEHMRKSGNKARKPASARGVPVDTDGKTAGAVAGSVPWEGSMANRRTVWTVASKGYKGAHFATFPPDLVLPCILAGCPAGGCVLDPFLGSGTTAMVAQNNGCNAIGIELNPEYIKLAHRRTEQSLLLDT